jgi:3-phosphoshikimate 1-carboxyvinyltransferase
VSSSPITVAKNEGSEKLMPLASQSSQIVKRAVRLAGALSMPGDKSISHRYAMLAALAEGTSEISGFASSADCASTLGCLRELGVRVERKDAAVTIHGVGMAGLRAPVRVLDAGNSGSTIRMLTGILAAQPFRSSIGGDASLSRRPMQRVITPLTRMGARIQAQPGGLPPLEIEGGSLHPIRYELPVASAQVKTAVLLAGLFAEGETEVVEPAATRDHTEIALEQMGAEVGRHHLTIAVRGPARLEARPLRVPGDISSAAFFLAAALVVPEANLYLQNVGLNPTRTAILDLLVSMGGRIRVVNVEVINGELMGDLHAEAGPLEGGEIPVEMVPGLIDELPVLSVLGSQTEKGIWFHGAGELRVKESDRLKTVAENLRRMGTEVEEFPDGLRIAGRQRLRGARIDSFGDHRIAMAFAVAGLAAEGNTTICGSDCAAVSFPEFFDSLRAVCDS